MKGSAKTFTGCLLAWAARGESRGRVISRTSCGSSRRAATHRRRPRPGQPPQGRPRRRAHRRTRPQNRPAGPRTREKTLHRSRRESFTRQPRPRNRQPPLQVRLPLGIEPRVRELNDCHDPLTDAFSSIRRFSAGSEWNWRPPASRRREKIESSSYSCSFS